jgi:hypothetical protein
MSVAKPALLVAAELAWAVIKLGLLILFAPFLLLIGGGN